MINDKLKELLNEATTVSTITRINNILKKNGREERLVRGRGYYYLHGGKASGFPETSIYTYNIGPEDFNFAWESVKDMYKKADIILKEQMMGDKINANSPAVTMPIMSRS